MIGWVVIKGCLVWNWKLKKKIKYDIYMVSNYVNVWRWWEVE